MSSVTDEHGNAISLKRVAQLTGKDVPFQNVDVCDEAALEKVFSENKFDGIIHLAALKAVGESVAKPLQYYSNNLVASLNLIQVLVFGSFFRQKLDFLNSF